MYPSKTVETTILGEFPNNIPNQRALAKDQRADRQQLWFINIDFYGGHLTTQLVQLTTMLSEFQYGELMAADSSGRTQVCYSCDSQAVVLWCRLF